MHDWESRAPFMQPFLDRLPFLVHYMAFNDNFFFDLINFCINNTSSNSFNSPLLNIIFLNIENICEISVLMIGVFKFQRTYLNILLLLDDIIHCQFFIIHQILEPWDFGLELLRISRCEETHEIKHLLVLSLEVFDRI